MELIDLLTNQLGISSEQASGGSGLLFKLAKDQLSGGDFEQLSSAIPGLDSLINAAPQSGGLASMLGGLASSLGGGSSDLGNLAVLLDGFKSLDLDADMIGKFVPVVLSFVQSQGGDVVKSILEKVLK